MSELKKKKLIAKIVKIYSHTFITDPITEIIP